ncbi:MAG: TrkA family potassium uptake protein [Nitrospinae bacterium]|nr:TrkA family potassium uptake protein [Nitrospinota bacterium]
MKKGKFVVIGLGKFGFYLAKNLFLKGNDVIAIDKNKETVQKIKDYSSEAIIADVTEKETFTAIGIEDADAVIVGLGTSIASSILITHFLKELRVKKIIVKAMSEEQGQILNILGADDIIFPEKDMAEKVANSIGDINIVDSIMRTNEFSIVEIAPPNDLIGKKLSELNLRDKFRIQVIAIKELIPERTHVIPSPDFVIKDSDILIIIGEEHSIEAFSNL